MLACRHRLQDLRAARRTPAVALCRLGVLCGQLAESTPAWTETLPLIQAEVKHLLDVRKGQRQNVQTNETA